MTARLLVTFDLFSALIDSRRGGSQAFQHVADERRWPVSGENLYDTWDRANKASQKDETTWVSFVEHSQRAMAATLATYGLQGNADLDARLLLDTVGDWPLWPDVADGLSRLAERHRVGILSNVDLEVFRSTAVAKLVVESDVFTSELLGCYKPAPAIYHKARELAGAGLVHVATSARDVRGALEAGVTVIRLRRPGHELDTMGPRPDWEAAGLAEVELVLKQALSELT